MLIPKGFWNCGNQKFYTNYKLKYTLEESKISWLYIERAVTVPLKLLLSHGKIMAMNGP